MSVSIYDPYDVSVKGTSVPMFLYGYGNRVCVSVSRLICSHGCVISTVMYNVESIPILKQMDLTRIQLGQLFYLQVEWTVCAVTKVHTHNNYIMAQKPMSSSNSQSLISNREFTQDLSISPKNITIL